MASLALGGSALPLPRAIYRLLILVPTVKLGYAEWSENPPRSWSWFCSWFLNSSANKSQRPDQISQQPARAHDSKQYPDSYSPEVRISPFEFDASTGFA
jgi:hypothetical protein